MLSAIPKYDQHLTAPKQLSHLHYESWFKATAMLRSAGFSRNAVCLWSCYIAIGAQDTDIDAQTS